MSTTLDRINTALSQVADPAWAEDWDNVGWLSEPTRPRPVHRIMLTIDLTDAVMEEAIRRKAELIVAYHPPVFTAARRTGQLKPAVVRAIEKRIAIYSPHTALDAAPGGVCDWLVEALGRIDHASPINPATDLPPNEQLKIVTFIPHDAVDRVRQAMAERGAGRIGDYAQCSFGIAGFGTFHGGASTSPAVGKAGRLERAEETRLEMVCGGACLAAAIAALRQTHPYEEPPIEVYAQQPRPRHDAGPGRAARLARPITLNTLVRRIKRYLDLGHVRVAAPDDLRQGSRKIEQVGLCPGAGGSLFEGTVCQAYLTGEMPHHYVLAKVEQGSAVILTDHTNTERGYLPVYKRKLGRLLGKAVTIHIARADREPLAIV
jgi:dinuclear metal center YbgI/SA1388 family protein